MPSFRELREQDSLTLVRCANESNGESAADKLFPMEPEKLGRSLGIGVRVAGNMLRDRVNRLGQPEPAPSKSSSPQPQPTPSAAAAPPPRSAGQRSPAFSGLGSAARRVEKAGGAAARGAKRFGEALWGPLVHAGSILWLEISGVFFALFAAFFAQNVYRVRGAWRGGPERAHLLLYVAGTALFVWFSLSSFLRARRKGRQKRAAR